RCAAPGRRAPAGARRRHAHAPRRPQSAGRTEAPRRRLSLAPTAWARDRARGGPRTFGAGPGAAGRYNRWAMSRRKSRFLRKPVEPFRVDADLSADDVLNRMERVSFQGRNLATARRIWEKMLASDATIFLGT